MITKDELQELFHFYQCADRLEIVNHGGLYGRARPENFPNVSDYRNPIIAEAMKVLGYVNCYNRGINMVQDELEANGNGKAEFSFRLITAFETKVALAGKEGQQGLEPEEQKGRMKDNVVNEKVNGKVNERQTQILAIVSDNPYITQLELASKLGISLVHINKNVKKLQGLGMIRRVGPDKGGHWEVVG